MKKNIKLILIFTAILISNSAFKKLKNYKNDGGGKLPVCGSVLDIHGNIYSDSWGLHKIKFICNADHSYDQEINTDLYNTNPDGTYPFEALTFNVEITLYEDLNPSQSGYFVLKDGLGNVISCQQIVSGNHVYTFSNIGSCNWYNLYIQPTSC